MRLLWQVHGHLQLLAYKATLFVELDVVFCAIENHLVASTVSGNILENLHQSDGPTPSTQPLHRRKDKQHASTVARMQCIPLASRAHHIVALPVQCRRCCRWYIQLSHSHASAMLGDNHIFNMPNLLSNTNATEEHINLSTTLPIGASCVALHIQCQVGEGISAPSTRQQCQRSDVSASPRQQQCTSNQLPSIDRNAHRMQPRRWTQQPSIAPIHRGILLAIDPPPQHLISIY
jgi:hypothetical protein